MDIEDFAMGMILGGLLALGMVLLFIGLFPSPTIDIITNVTSVAVDMNGHAILNTEVGRYQFSGLSTSNSDDIMISQSIPKCEPVVLHVKDGYVRSYSIISNHVKGC